VRLSAPPNDVVKRYKSTIRLPLYGDFWPGSSQEFD
jgi:hypothetical protein